MSILYVSNTCPGRSGSLSRLKRWAHELEGTTDMGQGLEGKGGSKLQDSAPQRQVRRCNSSGSIAVEGRRSLAKMESTWRMNSSAKPKQSQSQRQSQRQSQSHLTTTLIRFIVLSRPPSPPSHLYLVSPRLISSFLDNFLFLYFSSLGSFTATHSLLLLPPASLPQQTRIPWLVCITSLGFSKKGFHWPSLTVLDCATSRYSTLKLR